MLHYITLQSPKRASVRRPHFTGNICKSVYSQLCEKSNS